MEKYANPKFYGFHFFFLFTVFPSSVRVEGSKLANLREREQRERERDTHNCELFIWVPKSI